MSKFSKVDYVSTARAIDATWSQLVAEGEHSHAVIADMMTQTVTAFADMYEQDNPRFDRARFVAACEGDRDEVDS